MEAYSETTLREFGEAVAVDPRLSRVYARLADAGVDVDLNFGQVKRLPNRMVLGGEFAPGISPGRVTIFARAHRDLKEMLATFVHEGRHALDNLAGIGGNSRWNEYREFVSEHLFMHGRVPSRAEMGVIARGVLRDYAHLDGHVRDARLFEISQY